MDSAWSTFSLFQVSLMTLEANCRPRSEITCRGRPVHRQTWSRYSWAVSSADIAFRHGVMTIALLKRSTTTNIESADLDSGRSVTKSMVMDCQTPAGMGFGCNGICVLGLFFVVWHVAHPST